MSGGWDRRFQPLGNLVAVGYPTAVFVSDLSYFALFATKQNPHYVEMVLIVLGRYVRGNEKLVHHNIERIVR